MRSATTSQLNSRPNNNHFNPRTPCGVRPLEKIQELKAHKFQSTHSMRSATAFWQEVVKTHKISIHALHAECDFEMCDGVSMNGISIHALHAECDGSDALQAPLYNEFQSTHSMRSATQLPVRIRPSSPHFNPRTPCGVRPSYASLEFPVLPDFNPRTPCGVRPGCRVYIRWSGSHFNPRTPCGVRRLLSTVGCAVLYFNPRTPCGVRQLYHLNDMHAECISIHALHAECDVGGWRGVERLGRISIHALHAECDVRAWAERGEERKGISIHALHAECDNRYKVSTIVIKSFQSTHSMRSATHIEHLHE